MPYGVTWTEQDIDAVYPWSQYLPADDQAEFLNEINAYVGEHHGYTPEWYALIKAWRKTAQLWRNQPDTMAALVANLEKRRPDPDVLLPTDWAARARCEYVAMVASQAINLEAAPQIRGLLARTTEKERRGPLWRRVLRLLTGINTRKADA